MDKTLLKGLEVLEYVVLTGGPVRSIDIANDLQLQKSNVHRVLKTLQAAGYLQQDERTREYTPTLKLWELGAAAVADLGLRQYAAGAMRELSQASGETVHLSVLDGRDVIYIDKIDSPQPVAAYTRMGGRAPAYCVATGKALLSALSPAQLEPLMETLDSHSPETITDRSTLLVDLQQVRERGYSINRGEWREDVWGIAANIRDASGFVVAAIGISGPKFRLDEEHRLEELGAQVKAAARQIETLLGSQ